MSYPVFNVPAGDVLPVFFSSYAGSTGASVTLTGLAVTDIEIFKDGSTTQRASDAGYTLLDTDGIDFDGITGIHGFSIDTGDNTDSGFYAVGAWFHVVVSAVTIDSQTVSFIACAFRLMAAEGVAGKPKADVDAFGGTAGTFSSGRPEVNTTHWGGTAVASAVVPANTIQISGDSVAADNAESFFDGTGYAGTNNVIPTVTTVTTTTNLTNLPAAAALEATLTSMKGATFDTSTDSLEALRNRGDAAWTTATGFSTHSAADVWSVGTRALTDKAGFVLSATGSAAMTEGYAALGAAATLPQLLYEVRALLAEKSISGTTLTAKKLDGSTTATTYTLDDATTPSAITRAT